MNNKDQDIIEVEVVAETVNEVDDSRKQKASRTAFDHSKTIAFWGKLQYICFRFCWFTILTGIGAFYLTILYSNTNSIFYLVCAIILWSITGLLLIMLVIGIISRGIMRQYKKRDPNFENHVQDDEIY